MYRGYTYTITPGLNIFSILVIWVFILHISFLVQCGVPACAREPEKGVDLQQGGGGDVRGEESREKLGSKQR